MGARFDEMTLAAFVAVLIAVVATVCSLGPQTAEERLGCGVVNVVNRSLDLDQPCHKPLRPN